MTFGKLINLMEEKFIINSDVKNGFKLFLYQRNKIAHSLTKEERYDISTSWGQKETVGFLCLFIRNACALKKITESAKIASIGLGYFISKKEKSNKSFEKDYNQFYNNKYINEQLDLFFDTFKMKK